MASFLVRGLRFTVNTAEHRIEVSVENGAAPSVLQQNTASSILGEMAGKFMEWHVEALPHTGENGLLRLHYDQKHHKDARDICEQVVKSHQLFPEPKDYALGTIPTKDKKRKAGWMVRMSMEEIEEDQFRLQIVPMLADGSRPYVNVETLPMLECIKDVIKIYEMTDFGSIISGFYVDVPEGGAEHLWKSMDKRISTLDAKYKTEVLPQTVAMVDTYAHDDRLNLDGAKFLKQLDGLLRNYTIRRAPVDDTSDTPDAVLLRAEIIEAAKTYQSPSHEKHYWEALNQCMDRYDIRPDDKPEMDVRAGRDALMTDVARLTNAHLRQIDPDTWAR